jgi:glycosyltransferase involved in cell wall biosynthesis
MSSNKNPKVSVVMITYNHQKFIAQAVEGVAMQKTDFPFELIIGEDCSSDRTREIALDLQVRYPNIVKVLLPESNLGVGRNTVTCLEACKGEYVTFCEGDDFWTDPNKLAKQVEVLDTRPEVALCFHKVGMLDDITGENVGEFPDAGFREHRMTHQDVIRKNWIATCSAMFRRKDMPSLDDDFAGLQICDWALFILLTRHGYVEYIDKIMGQYRVHGGGVWSSGNGKYRIRETVRTLEYALPFVKAEERIELKKRLNFYCMRAAREALDLKERAAARKFFVRSLFHKLGTGRIRGTKHIRFVSEMYFPWVLETLRSIKHSTGSGSEDLNQ